MQQLQNSLLSTSPVRPMPEVQVGDLIQYRYRYSKLGTALETRAVIEVIDGGAKFVVEGFYNVWATQVTAHISMNNEKPDYDDRDFD